MRITRYLVAAVVLLTLALVGLVVVPLVTPPWVESISRNVLRSNASPELIAGVQRKILFQRRQVIEKEDGTQQDPSRESISNWSTGTSPEQQTTQVSRGNSQTTDQNGHQIKFERIESSGSPTLLFIEFDGPGGPESIATEIVQELVKKGVRFK